jgi:hypothetical protein
MWRIQEDSIQHYDSQSENFVIPYFLKLGGHKEISVIRIFMFEYACGMIFDGE